MKLGFMSLAEAAAKFAAIERDMKAAPGDICEAGLQIIEKEAKDSLGSYHRGWKQLAQSTQAERVREGFPANEPGLRTGEMRDSIEHTVVEADANHAVGYVGSNDDHLLWFELGTSRGEPPRSVLAGAAMRKGKRIASMAQSRVAAAFDGRGAEAREWREIMHAIKEVGHQAKKIWDEVKPEDEDNDQ